MTTCERLRLLNYLEIASETFYTSLDEIVYVLCIFSTSQIKAVTGFEEQSLYLRLKPSQGSNLPAKFLTSGNHPPVYLFFLAAASSVGVALTTDQCQMSQPEHESTEKLSRVQKLRRRQRARRAAAKAAASGSTSKVLQEPNSEISSTVPTITEVPLPMI